MIDAGVVSGNNAQGEPELIGALDAHGKRLDVSEWERHELLAPAAKIAREVTPEQLRGWYRDMVLVRRMDTEATNLQRHGELGLWAPLLGQEAAQIGAGRAMRTQDFAFPSYREHGVAWCRGVSAIEPMEMYRGTTLGAWDPNKNNFALYTIVIGNQCLHAAGYAMGIQRDGLVGTGDVNRDVAVMAFFGDGGSAQGDVNEAFVFAGVNSAPVVFFTQNNQWAISEPNSRGIPGPLYKRASGFGFPGMRVDGNDVIATYAVTRAMMDRARAGQGPAYIEAYTYRMGAHTTTDDPTRYRDAAETEAWKAKDPISRVKTLLTEEGMVDSAFFANLDEESDTLAEGWREACRNAKDPEPLSIFDNVYNDPHSLIDEEREQFIAYHESFAD